MLQKYEGTRYHCIAQGYRRVCEEKKKKHIHNFSNTIHSQEIIKQIEQMIITEFYR